MFSPKPVYLTTRMARRLLILKIAVSAFLSVTVPAHQIPHRRVLLSGLWQQATIVEAAPTHESVGVKNVREVPRTFRRCRPCVVEGRQKVAPPALYALFWTADTDRRAAIENGAFQFPIASQSKSFRIYSSGRSPPTV